MAKPYEYTDRCNTFQAENDVMDLWDRGLTAQEIATALGKSLGSVSNILFYMGAKSKPDTHHEDMERGSFMLATAIQEARAGA